MTPLQFNERPYSSDKGQRIGKPICGSYEKSFQITSTGRRITLKFKSDNESESRGFKASYRIFDNPWASETDNKVPLSLEQTAVISIQYLKSPERRS